MKKPQLKTFAEARDMVLREAIKLQIKLNAISKSEYEENQGLHDELTSALDEVIIIASED